MSAEAIELEIVGRIFTLACEPNERADLKAAAALVAERVEEAQTQSGSANGDRLLLLAALNLAHDLRRTRAVRGGAAVDASLSDDKKLSALRQRIEAVLG